MASDLGSRLKIALPLVALLTFSIFYAPGFAQFFVALVLVRSLWEFYNIYRETQASFSFPALMFSVFYLWVVASFSHTAVNIMALLGFAGLFGLQMTKVDEEEKGMPKMAFTLMGFVYVIYLGSYLFHIHNLHPEVKHWGNLVLFSVIFICKFSDATAYFGGKKFGKRKLSPKISPNKTQEGLLFAYLGALVPWPFLAQLEGFGLWSALGFCLLLATTAFIGDLFESMFKRELKVKDTANDIPAFGGTLDMIDSILLSMPAAYWYIQVFELHP